MAEPLTINVAQAAKATPLAYTVPGSAEIEPLSAFAHFDGASAAGPFRPALTFYSAAGLILARVFPATTVPVGGTADVTFAPFLGGGDNSAGLAGEFDIKVFSDANNVVLGAGAFTFAVPSSLAGTSLLTIAGYVTTVSSAGTPTVQIANVTTAVDVLSTKLTIDASEFTSYTAATPAVVNAANAAVSEGDLIRIDVDVTGTGAKGLGVILGYG